MFTRSLFGTADIEAQQRLLTEVARLVDARQDPTTLGENFGTINAANLKPATRSSRAARRRARLCLAGF